MASLYPEKIQSDLLEHREKEYYDCIESLKKTKIDLELYIFDNTIDELNEIRNQDFPKPGLT